MTRKDYILLTAAFIATKPGFSPFSVSARDQWTNDVHSVASAIKRSNPAFDAHRFLKACGVEQS